MLLDNETMFADSLAHDGTVTEINLGTAAPGPGQPVKCFFTTEATLTGATAIEFLDRRDRNTDLLENARQLLLASAAYETESGQIPGKPHARREDLVRSGSCAVEPISTIGQHSIEIDHFVSPPPCFSSSSARILSRSSAARS